MSLNVAIDQLHGYRVHGYGAGAVDHAIADDGLGVDSREGFGGFVS